MPHRQLPNSIPTVVRLLTTARDTYINTSVSGRAITADQYALLDTTNPYSLLSRFLRENSAVDLDVANQAPLTNAIGKTAVDLTMIVSHFHQVLDLGITR